MLRPTFTPTPVIKNLINIGALMDIPTGYYLPGQYGESLLNGGLGSLTAIVGIGNNFKSTVLHYMMLSAASKIQVSHPTSMTTYDTEMNIHEPHLRQFAQQFDVFRDLDVLLDGTWTITDKSIYYANDWFEILKSYLKEKKKNEKTLKLASPFLDRDQKSLMQIYVPTFSQVDSFTEFETADVAKMKDDHELGDSGARTIHMQQGLSKQRFLMEIPSICVPVNHYMLFTAQLGKESGMAGPHQGGPTKKLQYLKNGDKIKGTTDKFTFMMSNCWNAYNATPLLNDKTRMPEYPLNPEDDRKDNTDLNTVSMRQLRSKSGPTGITVDLVVTQSQGVLPSLTEFNFIRKNQYYGLSGGTTSYHLDLYPGTKLTRPTVRAKLDQDPLLRRAVQITAELLQIQLYMRLDSATLCDPATLYKDLKEQGYDWDQLLSTRGWWTLNNDKHPVPYLSTMDLLNMRLKTYRPYWL